jgi:dienelactone hydrolase
VAIPAGARLWPGVMVVHDFAGMGHDLRNQAEWLASEGFLVARWICTAGAAGCAGCGRSCAR